MFTSRMTNIDVERDYQPGLPRISAYSGELNQVWTALIENALDAMGDKGRLLVACRLEADMLLVEIWDNGPGIPPELQERIFEPFFTTKERGKGTGLGLATVYGIVKQHGGTLQVHSETGHGSTFRVFLPAVAGQAECEDKQPRGAERSRNVKT
jgi:signal transduction histidine kinase